MPCETQQAFRDASSRRPSAGAAIAIMRTHTPIRRLISRHTRELLRRYASAGMLSSPIAERHVDDHFIDLSEAERDLYEAVEEYISKTYNQAASTERSAIGFVMTVYRRRLASSFAALRATFERRRDRMMHGSVTAPDIVEDDTPDDEALDEIPDTDDLAAMAMRAAGLEERSEIEQLLERVRGLPPGQQARTTPRRRWTSWKRAGTARSWCSRSSRTRWSFCATP